MDCRQVAPAPQIALKSTTSGADKAGAGRDDALARACRSFEGLLIGEMLKTMGGGEGGTSGILPAGRGEVIFRRQQSEALGDAIAGSSPLGIARLLEQSLRR